MIFSNLFAVGKVIPPTGFGKADGVIKLHLCQKDVEQTTGPPISETLLPGNGPFTIDVHSGFPTTPTNYIKTIQNQPVCTTPSNINIDETKGSVDFNVIVDGLPAAPTAYVLICKDNSTPVPKTLPITSGFFIIQPPFVTLEATVNPGGEETQVDFEYGLDGQFNLIASYGKITGFNNQSVHLHLKAQQPGSPPSVLTSLLPGKTYNYRVRATNIKGVEVGPVKTFNTPSYTSAPQIINCSATDIS